MSSPTLSKIVLKDEIPDITEFHIENDRLKKENVELINSVEGLQQELEEIRGELNKQLTDEAKETIFKSIEESVKVNILNKEIKNIRFSLETSQKKSAKLEANLEKYKITIADLDNENKLNQKLQSVLREVKKTELDFIKIDSQLTKQNKVLEQRKRALVDITNEYNKLVVSYNSKYEEFKSLNKKNNAVYRTYSKYKAVNRWFSKKKKIEKSTGIWNKVKCIMR